MRLSARQCSLQSKRLPSDSHQCRRAVHCCSSSSSDRSRRDALLVLSAPLLLLQPVHTVSAETNQITGTFEPMPGLKGKDYGKSRMTYPDFITTPSGLQYKDMRLGRGGYSPNDGDTAVVDWDGYTIGYYGRPFEARNKPKGSSFSDDNKEFFRFTVGSDQVIPAWNQAIIGMTEGGIRRIIVPQELGYPNNDWRKAGPQPTTFAGTRALGFVLENQGMIDKTLLMDIELIRVVKPGEVDSSNRPR